LREAQSAILMGNWIEATTFADLLGYMADQRPEAEALIFPHERLSYRELRHRAVSMARSLAALSVGRGDKVGILMPNCPDYVALLFGITMLGAVAVPINARFKRDELGYIIEHSDVRVLVTTDLIREYVDFVNLLQTCYPELTASNPQYLSLVRAPRLRQIVLLSEREVPGVIARSSFDALAEGVSASEVMHRQSQVRVRDVAFMMYTSGTTARPKGCLLSHETVVRNGMAAARRFHMRPTDRLWDPLPFFHMGGILPLTAAIYSGAAFLSMAHFEPETALEMMERERVTIAYPTFETITQALLHHPRFSETDFSRLRLVVNVGTPDRLRAMQQRLPHAVQVSAYGCTEGGGVIAYNWPDEDLESRVTTQGPPFEGIEVRIVDPQTGAPLPPNRPGEIVFRGYCLFDGYYKDPEGTAVVMDAEGWFHTGDLGALDAAGRIMYQGRLKDMLKVGGENVAAAEVESFLARHPAIKIIQVVGVPDERLVEVPAAFVELHEGASLTKDELIDFCKGQIASFKIPRYVRFVKEWPMSATKIQKFRLRQMLIEELSERT